MDDIKANNGTNLFKLAIKSVIVFSITLAIAFMGSLLGIEVFNALKGDGFASIGLYFTVLFTVIHLRKHESLLYKMSEFLYIFLGGFLIGSLIILHGF